MPQDWARFHQQGMPPKSGKGEKLGACFVRQVGVQLTVSTAIGTLDTRGGHLLVVLVLVSDTNNNTRKKT